MGIRQPKGCLLRVPRIRRILGFLGGREWDGVGTAILKNYHDILQWHIKIHPTHWGHLSSALLRAVGGRAAKTCTRRKLVGQSVLATRFTVLRSCKGF